MLAVGLTGFTMIALAAVYFMRHPRPRCDRIGRAAVVACSQSSSDSPSCCYSSCRLFPEVRCSFLFTPLTERIEMAIAFLYLAGAAAVAALSVLVLAIRQMSRQRKSLSRGQYLLFILLCLVGVACVFLYAALD